LLLKTDTSIRDELAQGTLKPLRLREGAVRFTELYLIIAERDDPGPGTLRLAQIIRESVKSECPKEMAMAA